MAKVDFFYFRMPKVDVFYFIWGGLKGFLEFSENQF